MKINIANKTAEQINFIIEAYTDKETVNALGHKYALPLIEGDVLEIRYYGAYSEPKNMIKPIGLKSASYCNYMNQFEG